MLDLIQYMQNLGFTPGTLNLDGSLYRFAHQGSKDAGWYVGWMNFSSKDGKSYEVCQFGSWRTGEIHLYVPGNVSKEDKKIIDERITANKRKIAEEKRLKQEDASAKANKRFPLSATEGTTPYLERKGLSLLFGARIYNDTVQVPVVDISGKLWGIQYIGADGQKRFLTGTKIDGTFHLIGEPRDEALLCEGFATGASLHMATGKPVIVAFNAGNLIPVATEWVKHRPEVKLTVCGDDDRFTMIEGKQVNVGREKALKAALVAQAACVFPVFDSDEGKPTDFNDLHLREGIDAVAGYFLEPAQVDVGFIPLGYDESVYFFYDYRSMDIVKITGFSKQQLFQIAPKEYWEERYSGEKGTDWDSAVNTLIQISKKIGPFDSSRVRGTGVWKDDGKIVLNTGRDLLVDGKIYSFSNFKSHYVYVQTVNRLPPLSPSPLTVSDCGHLIDACEALNWREEKSGQLLAGWLVLARLAGALPIRPHVWLTGGYGTGKSTVMERLIANALGTGRGHEYLQGGSTEAGIRQTLKASSIPVIFDEFETSSEASKGRVEALVELLRNTWSATRGTIRKGSASGISSGYSLSFAALVSSIRINLTNEADKSRFSILDLAPHGDDPKQWELLQSALSFITVDYGERLFARSVRMVKVIETSYAVLASALSSKVTQRFGQQAGMLLAGYWALRSDDPIDKDTAIRLVAELDLSREKDESTVTDEERCLQHLMTTRVTVESGPDRETLTIGEIIAGNCEEKKRQLRNYGIIVQNEGILIADSHAELEKIYLRTLWNLWKHSLRRLPGAKTTNGKRLPGLSRQVRCTFVPTRIADSQA